MDLLELMKERHSVRQYKDKLIEPKKRKVLDDLIKSINEETGLHIQIFYDEPECFHSIKAHYGKFSNVNNYIAIVGPKGKELLEVCGYYGEMLVLKAQELSLNTCWVALTHGRSKACVLDGEKEVCLIAIGYGENQGTDHKKKEFERVSRIKLLNDELDTEQMDLDQAAPEWFVMGVQAALLAPTAMNQQKFLITYNGECVHFKAGFGYLTKLDLGIVEYHFETIAELYQ